MNLKFQIFIPEKRKSFPFTNTLLVSLIGLSILIYILDYFSVDFISNKIIATVMLVGFLSFFLRAAIVRGKVKPYHGRLEGWIYFSNNGLKINDEEIDINNLTKLDFEFGSYYSEFIHHTTPIIYPWRENGTNNFLKLNYIDGTKRSIQFQRMYEDQQKYLKPFLEYLYAMNLMSFLRLIDILGITDYEEIQDYKKEIKTLHNNQSFPD
ncbi:MAG: hypothetical protein CMC96_04370 [Flavobacteriales bacterium]|nr:hypothetical protein [Flavobacteriales bacterium]|tara:strand:- start:5816 stop:6442 length:627 start_codon:yes stop_codon:yes gene_type:complete